MNSIEILKLKKSLKKSLDLKRYEHTLGVAYTATALAMCYGANIKQAEIAGLLHDCAKSIDNDKKLSLCEKFNIQINDVERKNPFLLHAKLGSFYAMKKYGIRDKEIINAILNHTTGRPEMSLIEKIIFVADYIEPNRKQAPNLLQIRKLAFHNLDHALLIILEDTLKYLSATETDIDPMTKKTFEYYKTVLDN